MRIYVAASFCYEDRAKTAERKALIEKIVSRISAYLPGEYYLPHQLTIPNAWDISLEEWAKAVYDRDMQALNKADMVIFISFGKENNAGAVWEIGYVTGQNSMRSYRQTRIICVKMTDEPESLMVANSIDTIIKASEIEAYDWVHMPKYKTKMEKLS